MKHLNHHSLLVIIIAFVIILFASPSLMAATSISGAISSSATLTPADNPIRVIANTTVLPGATLTIEPGCVLEMSNSVKITVQGGLVADGTPEAPITFRKSTTSNWGRISFSDADPGSILDHCRIFGGYVEIKSTKSSGQATVSNCYIEHNASYCLLVNNANPTITSNVIRSYGGAGIRMNLDSVFRLAPTITANVITRVGNRSGNGLQYSLSGSDFVITIANNRIENFDKGIYISASSSTANQIYIRDCAIANNSRSLDFTFPNGTYQAELTDNWIGYVYLGSGLQATIPASRNYWTLEAAQRSNLPANLNFVDDRATNHFPEGDVDGDGGTDADDVKLIMEYLVGNKLLTDLDDATSADADGDGDIDMRDAVLIRAWVEGLIWKLPR
jgi:Right handed beta helix region/Dockerin type I domain